MLLFGYYIPIPSFFILLPLLTRRCAFWEALGKEIWTSSLGPVHHQTCWKTDGGSTEGSRWRRIWGLRDAGDGGQTDPHSACRRSQSSTPASLHWPRFRCKDGAWTNRVLRPLNRQCMRWSAAEAPLAFFVALVKPFLGFWTSQCVSSQNNCNPRLRYRAAEPLLKKTGG